jgi:hypothetical protein
MDVQIDEFFIGGRRLQKKFASIQIVDIPMYYIKTINSRWKAHNVNLPNGIVVSFIKGAFILGVWNGVNMRI